MTIPPLTIARLLMQALEVPDVDDILAMITDDNGDFIPLDMLEQRARSRAGDRGDV